MITFRETVKIIFVIATCICITSGAPVACDSVSAERCLNDFLTELEQTAFSNTDPEDIASDICNATYPSYQQCISSCVPSTNIWVKAAEYLCNTNETAQSEGLQCLAKPQVAIGVQMCNANIPQVTTDFCRTRDAHLSCVQGITSALCSPMGDAVVSDFMLFALQAASNAYNCDVTEIPSTTTATTTTTSVPTTTTTTPILVSTETVQGGIEVCARDCLSFISGPVAELMRGDFSLTWYTDACSNFTRYEECIELYTDCDTSNSIQHLVLRDPFAYSCGSGYSDILSQESCWEKPAVKEVWTSCLIRPSASLNYSDVCSIFGAQLSCLSSGIAQLCDQNASDIVVDFFNVTTQRVMMMGNCTLSVTTPSQQLELTTRPVTTPTPEPEAEVTTEFFTSEPEVEVTTEPSTPEPEAEVTAEPSEPEPDAEVTTEPSTPEPDAEVTAEPSTPEANAEVTVEPSTSEANAEVTAEPSTPEPEAEVTTESNTTSPESEVTGEPATTSSQPEVSTSPSAQCDILAYSQCLVDLNEKMQTWILAVTSDVTSTNTFNISHIDTLCSTFMNEYTPCTSGVLTGCTRDLTLIHDTLTSALGYLCSVDRDALLNTLPCLGQPVVIQGVQTCRNNIPQRSTSICQVSQDFTNCLSDVTSGVCTEDARSTLAELLSRALQPLNDYYPCDTTTSTTTTTTTTTTTQTSTSTTAATTSSEKISTGAVVSGPIKCYECHGGYGSKYCTPEGYVPDWYATAVQCKDSCFARTNKWNKGVIVRGCAGWHLPSDYPRPLPRSGCEEINGEMWCFCDGNKCNTMSMVDYLP